MVWFTQESVLKGKGVQKGWTYLKKEILKHEEQPVSMGRRRKPALVKQGVWGGAQGKKECISSRRKGRKLGGTMKMV